MEPKIAGPEQRRSKNPSKRRCTSVTVTGTPCTAIARRGTGRCRYHQADRPPDLVLALDRDLNTPDRYRAALRAIAAALAAGQIANGVATELRLLARESFDLANPPAPTPPTTEEEDFPWTAR